MDIVLSKMLKPICGWVVVKPDVPKDVSEGGVYLPDMALEVKPFATVIDVGTGPNGKGSCLSPGDRVVIEQSFGLIMGFEKEKYYLLRESDIHIIL
jgi:co-chaperonin GroES (HSP10)